MWDAAQAMVGPTTSLRRSSYFLSFGPVRDMTHPISQHQPTHFTASYLHHHILKMTGIKRRKQYKYKQNKTARPNKTSRTEMHPITRAFVCGAIIASRDGYASATALAGLLPYTQPSMSALVRRVESKARESGLDIWDPILYENNRGRGRRTLLPQEQKDAIIAIATSDGQPR